MMLGARTAAWEKSGYTAKDYVQDGLIAMWDGIENAGWGVHDTNATVWKDLVGGNDATLFACHSFNYDSVSFANNGSALKIPSVPQMAYCEIVVHIDRFSSSNEVHQLPVFAAAGSAFTFCGVHTYGIDPGSVNLRVNNKEVNKSTFFGRKAKIAFRVGFVKVDNQEWDTLVLSAIPFGSAAKLNGMFGRLYNETGTGGYSFVGKAYCVRCYSKYHEDIYLKNDTVDKMRFDLPTA